MEFQKLSRDAEDKQPQTTVWHACFPDYLGDVWQVFKVLGNASKGENAFNLVAADAGSIVACHFQEWLILRSIRHAEMHDPRILDLTIWLLGRRSQHWTMFSEAWPRYKQG